MYRHAVARASTAQRCETDANTAPLHVFYGRIALGRQNIALRGQYFAPKRQFFRQSLPLYDTEPRTKDLGDAPFWEGCCRQSVVSMTLMFVNLAKLTIFFQNADISLLVFEECTYFFWF